MGDGKIEIGDTSNCFPNVVVVIFTLTLYAALEIRGIQSYNNPAAPQ